jgi:AraC family cel operon transcriptional repressor
MEPKLLTADRFVDQKTGISYRYVNSNTEYFRPHYHDYYELFLIIDGKAIHKVNGANILLERGTMVFIRPCDMHDYALKDERGFSMLNITFTAETANALLSYLGKGFPSDSLLSASLPLQVMLSNSEIEYVLSHLATIQTVDESNSEEVKTALRILIFRILTRFFADTRDETRDNIPEWLLKLCEEMRKKENFTYGIAKMLSLTNKSREHISRSMKKYMGVTLSEFVNDLRLRFVASMLKNSNHDIADIIFESGFGNISWASELFKNKYGMTMSEYRKEI